MSGSSQQKLEVSFDRKFRPCAERCRLYGILLILSRRARHFPPGFLMLPLRG